MDNEQPLGRKRSFGTRLRRFGHVSWLITEHLFDALLDSLGEYGRRMAKEAELFLGTALLLLGLLNFQNGKNCDGNSADYLSCTRPSTYYYYSWFEITLVILGTFLILLWFIKMKGPRSTR